MIQPKQDDTFLCDRGDDIDNAVYDAICALSPGKKPEWDMSFIGPAADMLVYVMQNHGLETCRPWQNEDEEICYSLQDERCEHCPHEQEMEMSM